MCDTFLVTHQISKVQRWPTQALIEKDDHRMRQDLPYQPMLIVPQVVRPRASDAKTLRQLAVDGLDAFAPTPSGALQPRR